MRPTIERCGWRGLLVSILVVGCGASPPASRNDSTLPQALSLPLESEAPRAQCPMCVIKADPNDAAGYRRSRWLPPEERDSGKVPGLQVTDQDGTPHDFAALCDRPTALSFVYTRCTNPNKCPRVVSEIARLQSLLNAAKLETQVRLLVMTYDPEYDTPERLKAYGQKHGLRFTPEALMLRPEAEGKARLLDHLQVAVNYNSSGVSLHGVQLFLLDREGRFVRVYQSVFWENEEVLDDLRRLTGEGTPASSDGKPL